MRIESDFRDYYDWACDRTGPVLSRYSENSGPTKPEQLAILNRAGIQTPPHGKVKNIYQCYWEEEKRWIDEVVAYTRPECHRGEGKELWTRRDLLTESKMGYDERNEMIRRRYDIYCTALVKSKDFNWDLNKSRGLRLLQIGMRRFWIEYTSNESWMSNVGNGDCEVVDFQEIVCPHPGLQIYPLYAIDFVEGMAGMYAVDFNISPQIRGTGVEKLLKAEEVVDELEKRISCTPR